MPLVSVHTPREPGEGNRVGGARADFVAHLGRRVAELKQTLVTLETEPTAPRVRDDLRRRVHALASAARILKFHRMAEELGEAEHVLSRATAAGAASEADLAELRATFESVPSLAWGDSADATMTSIPPTAEAATQAEEMPQIAWPATALVVGASSLADALTTDLSSAGDPPLECERTDDPSTVLDLARAFAPDVVLLDADLPGAETVAERLVEDPLTEPVPIVVVGTFTSPAAVARWVALGVRRVLVKPASPASIQAACLAAVSEAKRAERTEPMGSVTVDELVERLTTELRRGLSDATSMESQRVKIDLGDGHDVMAALWSAVARIREVATVRSRGAVRFSDAAPEGAIALASLDEGVRVGGPSREAEPRADVSLADRTVLVADDDPAVTWFLSGVLRAAGATVLEAHDGEAALALAYRTSPELVISDILMPKLDGFSLCRALKRDVALRDVPVILLSWKEDLLQRVRELGASADGYLRKEASAQVVLARVREVLRPRVRVETRLSGGGEVRGRLDGLTVRTLLTLVSKRKPDARVSIRDASFLYELEIREGKPRRATRTAPDGTFEGGPMVLASALGVGAGRFVVSSSEGSMRGGLEGTLDEQLRPHVARSRAAQKLLSGPNLLETTKVTIDRELMAAYLAASPEPSRQILNRLAEGTAPRVLLLRGGIGARLLEDVLADAAVHGAVTRIEGANGEDLLASSAAAELLVLDRGLTNSLIPPPREMPREVVDATPSPLAPLPALDEADEMPPSSGGVLPALDSGDIESNGPPSSDDVPSLAALSQNPVPQVSPRDADSGWVSLLPPESPRAIALMKTVESITPSPMESALLGAIPDVAAAPEPEPTPLTQPEKADDLVPESADAAAPETVRELRVRARKGEDGTPAPRSTKSKSKSSKEAAAPAPPKSSSWGLVTFVLLAVGAGAIWFGHEMLTESSPPTPAPPPVVTSPPAATASVMLRPTRTAPVASDDETAQPPSMMPEDLPLAPGDTVPDGQGMLEIVAGRRDEILVDKLELGRGPTVKVPLAPGSHDVRARRMGDEQPVVVVIKPGRRTRVDLRGPWRR